MNENPETVSSGWSGERTRLACTCRRLAGNGSGGTPEPARETRALPGPQAALPGLQAGASFPAA